MVSADAIRGYIDIMILSMLREGPSYAYAMAKQISREAEGSYAIKQTTLYSAVKRLEATGLVTSFPGISESGKPRTYYQISDEGRAHLEQKIAEWNLTKKVVDRFLEGKES